MRADPGDRAAEWLQAWDSQGFHRTATEGDEAGADWLTAEAERMGAQVDNELFALDRVEQVEASVVVDGIPVEGLKMFDSPDTDPGGTDSVHVVELAPPAVYGREFRDLRTGMTNGAIVVVTTGDRPGLALLNAESFVSPFGPPVLQVSSSEAERITSASTKRVTIASRRTSTIGRNVVVTVPGTDPSLKPLVVMTPRSAWWQSTSERGGGLVCWLHVLRALIVSPPRPTVVMTANTGHELGHIGLDDFLARRPGWEQPDGATWVHFGANLGATDGRLTIQSSSEELRSAMATELVNAGNPADGVSPEGTVPYGETRDIHLAGGRYVTLVGTNPLFHLPDDRWPHAVNVDSVARIAQAATRVVLSLARQPRSRSN